MKSSMSITERPSIERAMNRPIEKSTAPSGVEERNSSKEEKKKILHNVCRQTNRCQEDFQ